MTYIVAVMLVIYFLLYMFKYRKYTRSDFLLSTLLYFYVWLILFLTIVPKNFSLNPNWQNVEPIKYPFENLKPYNDLILNRSGSILDVVLNLLMMMPFTFLYASVNKNVNIFKIFSTTFLFSLFIETIQIITTIFFVYGRNFDVTDIINNTLGGIIGYIIYKLFIFKKRRRNQNDARNRKT